MKYWFNFERLCERKNSSVSTNTHLKRWNLTNRKWTTGHVHHFQNDDDDFKELKFETHLDVKTTDLLHFYYFTFFVFGFKKLLQFYSIKIQKKCLRFYHSGRLASKNIPPFFFIEIKNDFYQIKRVVYFKNILTGTSYSC